MILLKQFLKLLNRFFVKQVSGKKFQIGIVLFIRKSAQTCLLVRDIYNLTMPPSGYTTMPGILYSVTKICMNNRMCDFKCKRQNQKAGAVA